MKTVAKNAPCPCGSGKKYKRCCLQKPAATAHAVSPSAPKEGWGLLIFGVLLLTFAGVGSYQNSFSCPFVFDDIGRFPDNPLFREWPPWTALSNSIRPMVDLTLALNHKLGGLHVAAYHTFNLIVHMLAALTLFGILRRTFNLKSQYPLYGKAGPCLALTAALLWMVHPLQTQSVTYISQRAESLMGLFFLLTLYNAIRAANSPKPGLWYALGVVACALGMASKATMAFAPLLVWLYDRIYLFPPSNKIKRWRQAFYLGLAASWIFLAALLSKLSNAPKLTAGFEYREITPLQYALTQPSVILHYLRLALWPRPLVFDYCWPIATTVEQVFPALLALSALMLAVIWLLYRRPFLGFWGAWFFLTLVPTSSFIPIADAAAEYRMYLPLAAVATLAVVTVYEINRRLTASRFGRWPVLKAAPLALAALIAATLGIMTFKRNQDYRSEESLWADTLAKRPQNIRAYNVLGVYLDEKGKPQEAIPLYEKALQMNPESEITHNNLGLALMALGKNAEALAQFKEAVRLKPEFSDSHYYLGLAFTRQGKLPEAASAFLRATQLRPDDTEAHYNLGLVLQKLGQAEEANRQFQAAGRRN